MRNTLLILLTIVLLSGCLLSNEESLEKHTATTVPITTSIEKIESITVKHESQITTTAKPTTSLATTTVMYSETTTSIINPIIKSEPFYFKVRSGEEDSPVPKDADKIFEKSAAVRGMTLEDFNQRWLELIEDDVDRYCPDIDEDKKWDFVYEKYYHAMMRAEATEYSLSHPMASHEEIESYTKEKIPFNVADFESIWSSIPSCADQYDEA